MSSKQHKQETDAQVSSAASEKAAAAEAVYSGRKLLLPKQDGLASNREEAFFESTSVCHSSLIHESGLHVPLTPTASSPPPPMFSRFDNFAYSWISLSQGI